MKKTALLFAVILMICLVFSASCVNKEVPVTETYYETQYKTETYTETENIVVHTSEGETYLAPISTWHAGIYFVTSGGAGTYYYGYQIDTSEHTKSQIEIALSSAPTAYDINVRVYNLTGVGQIPNMPTTLAVWRETNPKTGGLWTTREEQTWLDNVNALSQLKTTEVGDNKISFDAKGIGEFAIFANTFNPSSILSVKLEWSNDITEQRAVIKERQVPYEVEKQRTILQTKKVPFWEALFH
jgi:hypothetical protein